MLFPLFIGITLIGAGIWIASIMIKKQDFSDGKMVASSICLILSGVAIIIFSIKSVNGGWVIEEESFLAPVSIEDSYLIEKEGTYIYCKSKPDEEDELQLITTGEDTIIVIENISGDKPYMIKSHKSGWTKEEYKYVFYIPEQK